MGDRAGNFAFVYSGGINQLEGLMNDRAYLAVLRKKGDVKALLCQRDIRFVLSYEADLGAYQTHEVETIRKTLSQFPAPRIEVARQDEVGRFGIWPNSMLVLSEMTTATCIFGGYVANDTSECRSAPFAA